MALQSAGTHTIEPIWRSENAQNAPKSWDSLAENQIASPRPDSVMSDETTSASVFDIQMMLDNDENMDTTPLSPRPVAHRLPITDARVGNEGAHVSSGPSTPKPEALLTSPNQTVPNDLSSSGLSGILTPTVSRLLATTPRRSPRLSPAPSPAINPVLIQSSTQFSPVSGLGSPSSSALTTSTQSSVQYTPTNLTHNQASCLPAFPSPSTSQLASASIMSPQHSDIQDDQMQESEAVSSLKAHEKMVEGITLEEPIIPMEPNVQGDQGRIEDTSLRDEHMSESDGIQNPQAALMFPEREPAREDTTESSAVLQMSNDPPSNPDLSSIFASPIPNMAQPVLSPLRLHQGFQPFGLPSSPPAVKPDPSFFATPPPASSHNEAAANIGGSNRLGSLSPTQTSLLDKLVSPFSLAAAGQALQMQVPVVPPKQTSVIGRSNILNNMQDKFSLTGLKTPPSSVIIMEQRRNAPREVFNSTSKKDLPAFSGSLVPVTSPSNLHPPFPVTPQRGNAMMRSLSAPELTSSTEGAGSLPIGEDNKAQPSSLSLAPTGVFTPITSRIPIPQYSSMNGNHAAISTTVASPSTSIISLANALSPTTMSPGFLQLRQASTLRGMSSGAASKIPRPGKKPYSKPVSRLPKLQTKAIPVFPTVAPPPKMSQPQPVQVSPIKTRRGRLNAQNTINPASFVAELPPDAIIYKPPPPRIRPVPVPEPPVIVAADDTDVGTPEADEGLVSGRASPPVESGMSPPRSGLLLKSRAKRLKEEVASESVTPEFTATAPSLGIFPSLNRTTTKGRGRNNTQRPMLMPLDATSLKRITTSNTLRNQEYVCSKVDVKVILKEGKRPASPTTKVRTVLEKKKDQEKNDRQQRAAARSNGRLDTPDDQEMQDGDSSKRKHPRGAGEDSDYETPVKHRQERENMDVDEVMDQQQRKRVKWNKDLLQRFEPEDEGLEALKSRAEMARSRTVAKSCIAAPVLLDPLGNVPEAHIPIANLKKEDVVVTRLVYIDELPPSERPKRAAAAKANARITPT